MILMYQGVHGATCRSQEKIILPRPEGPRSRDRSAATYRMRQRKQKEWKGGSQAEGTNSKIRGWQESIAMQHAWRWSLEKGPPEMMLGSQARVFSHGIGAARGRGGTRALPSSSLSSCQATLPGPGEDPRMPVYTKPVPGAPPPWEGSPGPARCSFSSSAPVRMLAGGSEQPHSLGPEVKEKKAVRAPRGSGTTTTNEQQLNQALGCFQVPECTLPLPSASSRVNAM